MTTNLARLLLISIISGLLIGCTMPWSPPGNLANSDGPRAEIQTFPGHAPRQVGAAPGDSTALAPVRPRVVDVEKLPFAIRQYKVQETGFPVLEPGTLKEYPIAKGAKLNVWSMVKNRPSGFTPRLHVYLRMTAETGWVVLVTPPAGWEVGEILEGDFTTKPYEPFLWTVGISDLVSGWPDSFQIGLGYDAMGDLPDTIPPMTLSFGAMDLVAP